MKALLTILMLLLSISICAQEEDAAKKLMEASNLYNQANYEEAIQGYQELLKGHPHSGELYYNLANAYFKNGELGKSIFYYIQAERLMPRNGDVKYNLNYARNQKLDKQAPSKNLFNLLNIPFNSNEILIFMTICSLFFWGVMLLTAFKRNFILSCFKYTGLCALIISLVILIGYHMGEKDIAVVTAPESSVFSTTGTNSIKLFSLHEGTELIVLDTKDNWVLVSLGTNKKGWIPADKIIH